MAPSDVHYLVQSRDSTQYNYNGSTPGAWSAFWGSYTPNQRILGAAQAVAGLAETIAGVGLGWTGVGLLLAGRGLDDLQAGLRSVWTGQYTQTMTSLFTETAAIGLEADPVTAERLGMGVEFASRIYTPAAAINFGRVASRMNPDVGQVASSVTSTFVHQTTQLTSRARPAVSQVNVAPGGGGFGAFGGKKLAPGVISEEVSQFYFAIARSDRFASKLGLANRLSKGPAASVDDIVRELGSSEFLQIRKILGSRVDPISNGFVFRHGGGTGYFGRITAEHELLHLAQFIRNPSLRGTAGNLSFFKRQGYEFVPGLIGSPELHGTLGSTVLVGLGYTVVQSWGAAGEIYDAYWGPNAQ